MYKIHIKGYEFMDKAKKYHIETPKLKGNIDLMKRAQVNNLKSNCHIIKPEIQKCIEENQAYQHSSLQV